jgi:predicted negative regulator of RcsB-dependent stress response
MLAMCRASWYNNGMKLFFALVLVVGSYLGFLFYTSNIVLAQTKQLNNTYQYVANHSDEIATGQKQPR